MFEPKVSVIIPTHNRATYLLQALDSIFAQTAPPAEIIIIDDGSTDETRTVLDPFIMDRKIHYVFQDKKGVSAARNKGIEIASSPLVAFLDSDDLFLPTKLEKQIALFRQQPKFGFVHCSFSKFKDLGEDLGVRDTSRFSGEIYPSMLLEWSVLMAMPCMLVRADVLKQVGGFDEEMQWAEDLDLWRRIACRYEIGYVPEVLVRVRVHSESISAKNRGGELGFTRYLEKAFDSDPNLSGVFRRKAMGKLYANLGQNILGEGNRERMPEVRRLESEALSHWPLQVSAIATWIASYLPLNWRNLLINIIRRRRFPRGSD